MKKAAAVIIFLLLTISLVSLFLGRLLEPARDLNKADSNVAADIINTSTPTPIPEPETVYIESPARLSIPKLNINTKIEHVGLDDQRRMDVPKNYNNVAWYIYGSKPGQIGSSVIAGHYDSPNGSPAIFYYLDRLETGDTITVESSTGENLEFEVERIAVYKDVTFPIEEVFLNNDKPRLNLITCYGTWNAGDRNYTDRYVVYAVAKTIFTTSGLNNYNI
jgi:LPXTG-site transpeptidase (sortase) family protein